MPSDDLGFVTLRLYGGLAWFVSEADRDGIVEVPMASPRSVKDLVESVGVPHVEIGRLVVDGSSVEFDEVVREPCRVAVYPVTGGFDDDRLRPALAGPVRFVADVHLGVLARRLRALGFDTWWARDADDDELARRAVDDDRALLSRDRGLLMRRVVVHGYCPRSDDPEEQVAEVVARFDLPGRVRPFTRCVTCNGILAPVAKADVWDDLPPRTRLDHDEFVQCRDCGQVFWPGSHHSAMSAWMQDLLGDT
jgi:uncharacterized protein